MSIMVQAVGATTRNKRSTTRLVVASSASNGTVTAGASSGLIAKNELSGRTQTNQTPGALRNIPSALAPNNNADGNWRYRMLARYRLLRALGRFNGR